MRKTLVICALLAFAAIASAADNSIGTWKLDAGKSVAAAGTSPFKSLTVVRTAVPGGAHTTVQGARADGSKVDAQYTVKYDGKDVPVTGSGLPFDTISMTQADANTLADHRTKKGGSYNATGRFTVSKDGKSAELNVTGTGADGKPVTSKSVYTKQ